MSKFTIVITGKKGSDDALQSIEFFHDEQGGINACNLMGMAIQLMLKDVNLVDKYMRVAVQNITSEFGDLFPKDGELAH